MPYLNAQQREALVNELKNKSFKKALGKLRRMDPEGRLVFYRNQQQPDRILTRYELPSLGTRVTLVEDHSTQPQNGRVLKADYDFVEIIVEPTPENHT